MFPPVVRRGYERARLIQGRFLKSILESKVELPAQSCICISGSVSRLESVRDSDIDYVLIWSDHDSALTQEGLVKSGDAIDRINSTLTEDLMRPCESFSCQRPISDLISTENLFSRYCILTLIDSTFMLGDQFAYNKFLALIKDRLENYAIGISARTLVVRTLVWYIQREGWIDQLQYGTSVNRFSRLIQLFTTILSINQFGIGSTRTTKTTWVRIEKLEPFLHRDITDCLKRMWIRALELKEMRSERPMLKDSGFVAVSKLMELWKELQAISQTSGA